MYLLLLCVACMRVVCDYRWDGVTVSSFQTAGLPHTACGTDREEDTGRDQCQEPVAVILTGLTEPHTHRAVRLNTLWEFLVSPLYISAALVEEIGASVRVTVYFNYCNLK